MTFSRRDWAMVVAIALATHAGFLVAYVRTDQFGAEGRGEGGIEFDFGELAHGDELMQTAQTPEPTPPTPEPLIVESPPVPAVSPPMELQTIEIVDEMQFASPEPPVMEGLDPYDDNSLEEWRLTSGRYWSGGASGTGRSVTRGGIQGQKVRYIDRVRARLNRFKQYPAQARRNGQTGTSTLFLHVRRDGTVLDSYVDTSSGHSILDEEVLLIVERASPLPPFHEDQTDGEMKLLIPIEFDLIESD